MFAKHNGEGERKHLVLGLRMFAKHNGEGERKHLVRTQRTSYLQQKEEGNRFICDWVLHISHAPSTFFFFFFFGLGSGRALKMGTHVDHGYVRWCAKGQHVKQSARVALV
jgi:hypothetical protein